MLRPLTLTLLVLAASPAAAKEPPRGRITGVGGIFFEAKDPKALAAWYRDVLGLKVEAWGGAMIKPDAPGHPPVLVWRALPSGRFAWILDPEGNKLELWQPGKR